MTTLSDNILLERISQGDETSFDTLFHTHYERVYGLLFRLVGNRIEAEDLTQELFLKLYNGIVAQKLFTGRQEHNVSAWLYRAATNMGYNAVRDRKRRWQRDRVLVPNVQANPLPDQEVERREEALTVRRTLARLPKRQTQLLLLRQMDFSYAECAAICKVAPGSVGTLLARATKAFRKAYAEEEKREVNS